jgi:hypothetical protein
MGWKDRAIAVQPEAGRAPGVAKPSWKDRAVVIDTPPPQTGVGESLLRGAAQGATLGFEDELSGIGGVIGDKLGRLGVDKIESTHPEVQAQIDAIGQEPSMGDVYRETRDEERAKNLAASEANPGTYLAGNIAGAAANPASRAAGTLKGTLGLGAVQGLGGSEADLTQGKVTDAAVDTALGTGAGGLGYGLGKALPKVFDWIKAGGKKALTNFGPSKEAIEARLAGKAQDTAKSYPELAEDMSGSLKNLSTQISDADTAAWNTLSREPAIPKAYVTSPIDEAISKMKLQGQTIGAADKQAERVLGTLKDDLNHLGGNISEADLKSVIQKLDSNINWDDPSSTTVNKVLAGIRTKFDDTLKFQNSSYKKAMEPVSERMQVLDALKRKFGIKASGDSFTPSDTTASALKTSLNENKAVTQGTLAKLKKFTGTDYQDMANDYRLAQQFQKGPGAQGSKRTNLGAALGAGAGTIVAGPLGATIGAGVGALAGGAADAYGGKIAAKLIDSYLKAGNSAAFGKFAPIIEKAAAKGPEALAVLSSVLENNPEFRREMNLDSMPDRRLGSR